MEAMTRREKRIYIEEIKAIKKKEKSGLKLTIAESSKLIDYYNKATTRNCIIAGVLSAISLLIIIVKIVIERWGGR